MKLHWTKTPGRNEYVARGYRIAAVTRPQERPRLWSLSWTEDDGTARYSAPYPSPTAAMVRAEAVDA